MKMRQQSSHAFAIDLRIVRILLSDRGTGSAVAFCSYKKCWLPGCSGAYKEDPASNVLGDI